MPFIDRKRSTLLNQMGVYGQQGMNPAAGQAPAGGGTPGSQGAAAGAGSTVRVLSPDGKTTGTIPAAKLQQAIQQGYKQVQ
jgi:hypothetical protein